MRIYMDVCCLNRPFDSQKEEKVRLEADAVISILQRCESGEWILLGGDVIEYEISKNPDPYKKEKVGFLYSLAKEKIEINEDILCRGRELEEIGFSAYDALHIASAEYVGADVFLTTDEEIIRKSKKNINTIKVEVENPVIWFMEVMRNEP
jgi:predicted nucleic acid-binding protein